MKPNDINVIQDSRIAMTIVNKMIDSGGMNMVYIDNRTADIDNRQQTMQSQQPQHLAEINDNREMIPNVTLSNTAHIPNHLLDDLEAVIQKFPQPRLDHMIKAVFKIALRHGSSNEERGKWLGIERGKTQYWIKKLKVGEQK